MAMERRVVHDLPDDSASQDGVRGEHAPPPDRVHFVRDLLDVG